MSTKLVFPLLVVLPDRPGNASNASVTTEVLDLTYDTSGDPYSLTYNGTTYYYVVNLQGDVIRLVSGTGATVAEYKYDPYGQVSATNSTLAKVNPLRYRGYYYDAETEFYYLQSRYYDPTICRFINADGYASTGQGFLRQNMFAYCGNCPVDRVDLSGNAWWGTNTVAIADGKMPDVILTSSDDVKPEYGPSSTDLLNHIMESGAYPEHDGLMYIGVECDGYYFNKTMSELAAVGIIAADALLTYAGAKASVEWIRTAANIGSKTLDVISTADAIWALCNPLDKSDYYQYKVTTVWHTEENVYTDISSAPTKVLRSYKSVSYYVWDNDSQMEPYFYQVSCKTTELSCVPYGN